MYCHCTKKPCFNSYFKHDDFITYESKHIGNFLKRIVLLPLGIVSLPYILIRARCTHRYSKICAGFAGLEPVVY